LPFYFALQYTNKKIHENHEALELSATQEHLVYEVVFTYWTKT